MKRLGSFLAILAIIFVSNCTEIPENNDPVIGIWSLTKLQDGGDSKSSIQVKEEWIFNDAYLGRYHRYEGNKLAFKTDYRWEQADGLYSLSYPGTDMAGKQVRMQQTDAGIVLEDEKGNILAIRE